MARSSLVGWFDRHTPVVQGVAAIITAMIALSALVGVKLQIDAAARNQQEQSARDIYREYLNLSISRPEFSEPDYCAIKGSPQEAAYKNYVDYLLYTAEQMLSVSPEWESALSQHLGAHEEYLCSVSDWSSFPDTVEKMVSKLKIKACTKTVTTCDQ